MAEKAHKNEPAEEVLGDFDPLVVHHRDPVTKRIVRVNPYKLIVQESVRFYEHPVGSGNLWYENRKHAGRLEAGVIKKGAAHKAYTPPVTADEALASKVMTTQQENERLLKELAEIKKELAAKPVQAGAKNV